MNKKTNTLLQGFFMRQMKNFIGLLIFLFPMLAYSQASNDVGSNNADLDATLQKIIQVEALKPLDPSANTTREMLQLGANLYHEVELSGKRNIGCFQCHHPRFGTADGMPFSIGEGGQGMGGFRKQNSGGLTKRHSPHLLNLGYDDIEFMFWDGRVHRDAKTGVLTTPEPALNGANPAAKEIAALLTSSLAAQVLFPMVNDLEMRGGPGNDVADAGSNLKSWEAIMKRLLEGSVKDRYVPLFQNAFPGVTKFNIGHVGQALAAFIGQNFNLVDTPYDRYLRGDLTAMTDSEKRGLVVFATRGKCVKCHNGRHLSNFEFKTVATPQITPDTYAEPYDQGRFEVTGNKSDLFKFKTPPLRNISLTAPFMHNGAFKDLEAVIKHYNDPKASMSSYDLSMADYSNYNQAVTLDQDALRNKLRINLISIGEVRRGINLTPSEESDLLQFLKTGLLEMRLQQTR